MLISKCITPKAETSENFGFRLILLGQELLLCIIFHHKIADFDMNTAQQYLFLLNMNVYVSSLFSHMRQYFCMLEDSPPLFICYILSSIAFGWQGACLASVCHSAMQRAPFQETNFAWAEFKEPWMGQSLPEEQGQIPFTKKHHLELWSVRRRHLAVCFYRRRQRALLWLRMSHNNLIPFTL